MSMTICTISRNADLRLLPHRFILMRGWMMKEFLVCLNRFWKWVILPFS